MPDSDPVDTWFAPAARSDAAALGRQSQLFIGRNLATALLEALSEPSALLNSHRQVIHANGAFLKLAGREHVAEILGLRPGEILQCVHVDAGPAGCGTSQSCATCGAVFSILEGQKGGHANSVCRLHCHTPFGSEAFDFRVSTESLEHAGERFVLFRLENITDEKRRQSLERLFFHDVLNLVGAIRGFTELLRDYRLEDREELHELLLQASHQLVDQVQGQRLLLKAERGELELKPQRLWLQTFLKDLVAIYRHHPVVQPVEVRILPLAEDIALMTDPGLLSRVLGNLVLNACEAVGAGGQVTVGCDVGSERIRIWVENAGEIPTPVQAKIFTESVSTKGRGRGLGTYSVRLFCDYLGGRAFFASGAGLTRFSIELPAA